MPTVISLFAGAGGLDIGLEQAGFQTVAATDHDATCVETLRRNQEREIPIHGHPSRSYLHGTRILHADVREVRAQDLRPTDANSSWHPDLLAGGPPCQSFSSSGKQRSVLEGRGRLFEHFVRLARELRPRTVLFENVRGLVTARGRTGTPGEVLLNVKRAFEDAGYATSFAVLNAADFGCPQRRVRLFMFGTRNICMPEFPLPTHRRAKGGDLFSTQRPWRTLGSLLKTLLAPEASDIVRPSPALEQALYGIQAGSGLKSKGRPEPTRPGGHWGYRQGTFIADPNLPARTVTASSSQDWLRLPDGSLRRLTLSECAALQGFPAKWSFAGSKARGFRQAGNAVPSIFGAILGEAIARAIDQTTSRSHKPSSALLPKKISAAIRYTERDHARNAPDRTRTQSFIRAARQAASSRRSSPRRES